MKPNSLGRRIFVAAMVAAAVALPGGALHAQWEEWLGGWMIAAFGICGGAGCYVGPSLCAVVLDDSGVSYCYER